MEREVYGVRFICMFSQSKWFCCSLKNFHSGKCSKSMNFQNLRIYFIQTPIFDLISCNTFFFRVVLSIFQIKISLLRNCTSTIINVYNPCICYWILNISIPIISFRVWTKLISTLSFSIYQYPTFIQYLLDQLPLPSFPKIISRFI